MYIIPEKAHNYRIFCHFIYKKTSVFYQLINDKADRKKEAVSVYLHKRHCILMSEFNTGEFT